MSGVKNLSRSCGFGFQKKIWENETSQNMTPPSFSRIFSQTQNHNFDLNFDSFRFSRFFHER